MTRLDGWLNQATRGLSKDSSAQVRTEIREHYELAREAAICRGEIGDEADRMAVTALGDAHAANREYRKVLLTAAEARMLGDAKWEARAVCSRPWLKWTLLALPLAALSAASGFFLIGAIAVARVLLVSGIGTGVFLSALFLPVYTPLRGRVFRCVKWVVLIAMLVLAFGPDALKWSWLLASSLWPMAWIEWTRVSIRRKLPVAKWPKPLYL
jgi:hypothetical protein